MATVEQFTTPTKGAFPRSEYQNTISRSQMVSNEKHHIVKGSENPTFRSNEVFFPKTYQNFPKNGVSTSQQYVKPAGVQQGTFDRYSKQEKLQNNQSSIQIQNDTQKKQPTTYADTNQGTLKKPKNNSGSHLLATQQKKREITEPPQRVNYSNNKQQKLQVENKYTDIKPDHGRYDIKTPRPVSSNVKLNEQKIEQEPINKVQLNNLKKLQDRANNNQSYMKNYTPGSVVRVNGRLQKSPMITPKAQIQQQQISQTPKSQMSQKSIRSQQSLQKNQSHQQQKQQQQEQQQQQQQKKLEVQQQPEQLQQQLPKGHKKSKSQIQSDAISVQSRQSEKSYYSRASHASHASGCSAYMCDNCYNSELISMRKAQKEAEKQREQQILRLKQQRDRQMAEYAIAAQQAQKQAMQEEMNNYYKNQPNQKERNRIEHEKEVQQHQQYIKEMNQQMQQEQQQQMENKLQTQNYIKQKLSEQVQIQNLKKEQEKAYDQTFAYDPSYDMQMRDIYLKQQEAIQRDLKNTLENQINDRLLSENQKKVQEQQQFNTVLQNNQKQMKKELEQLEKTQQRQREEYQQMLDQAIKYKREKNQNEKQKDVQQFQEQQHVMNERNRIMQEQYLIKQQELKEDIIKNLEQQLKIKQDRLQKEKEIDNFYSKIPQVQPKKPATKKCGTCKNSYLMKRLMKVQNKK